MEIERLKMGLKGGNEFEAEGGMGLLKATLARHWQER